MLFLLSLLSTPAVLAAETGDEAVQEVIAQLQAIDTLQEMQSRRREYPVSTRYDVGGSFSILKHDAIDPAIVLGALALLLRKQRRSP